MKIFYNFLNIQKSLERKKCLHKLRSRRSDGLRDNHRGFLATEQAGGNQIAQSIERRAKRMEGLGFHRLNRRRQNKPQRPKTPNINKDRVKKLSALRLTWVSGV
ncbi:hypothetical protein RRG08_042941 [Elysia crispata]|uniref:Uncharacterized protein n=1 Tax=Elysia crispata TaxID=231223 RepID=A0AAE1AWD7_9GAST|nr:hypothetical protein RRG08_042941 [Elysia crispata]